MYKEYRELSRADAVKSMYQDMAARHRARFRSIHVRRSVARGTETYSKICRFSVSSRSRRPRTSAARTSSSSWSPSSSSPCPTVSSRPARPLLRSVLRLSDWLHTGVLFYGVLYANVICCMSSLLKTMLHFSYVLRYPSKVPHKLFARIR